MQGCQYFCSGWCGIPIADGDGMLQKPGRKDSGSSSHGQVLVVEDDPTTRHALLSLLNKMGFEASGAATVAEGLAQLDGQSCLILDLNLPDGEGTEVLRRIRDEHRLIRVAVFSGTEDQTLMSDVRSQHPDRVFTKPQHTSDLLAWVMDQRGQQEDFTAALP